MLKVINVPKQGIRRIVGTRGVVKIIEGMPQLLAKYCYENGFKEYFEEVEEPEPEPEPTPEPEPEPEQQPPIPTQTATEPPKRRKK